MSRSNNKENKGQRTSQSQAQAPKGHGRPPDAGAKSRSARQDKTAHGKPSKGDPQSRVGQSTRKKGKHTEKMGDADNRSQDVNAELAALKAEVLKERATRQKLEEEVSKIKKRTKEKQQRIPKPRGSVGRGLNLIQEMRLTDNKPLYLSCLMTVRDLCLAGMLDWKKGIKDQDPGALGTLYEVARTEQPYLARFENDWATAQILMQFMANRRKNAIRRGRVVAVSDKSGRRVLKDVKVARKASGTVKGSAVNDEDLDEGNGLGVAEADEEEDFEEVPAEVEIEGDNDKDDEVESRGDVSDGGQYYDEDEDEEDADQGDTSSVNDESGLKELDSEDDVDTRLPPAKRRKLGNVKAV